jgi:Na+-transporting methylmalonyl-CoA/oxaloacetate decarboxylase gamma subunit
MPTILEGHNVRDATHQVGPLPSSQDTPVEPLLLLAQAVPTSNPDGWAGVVEGRGIELTIVGMAIVFAALVIISLFIAALPKVLEWLDPYLPKGQGHHAPAHDEQTTLDEEKVVAAIGLVLHTELQKVLRNPD